MKDKSKYTTSVQCDICEDSRKMDENEIKMLQMKEDSNTSGILDPKLYLIPNVSESHFKKTDADKDSHAGDNELDNPESYAEKLLDFIIYQPLQTYMNIEGLSAKCLILDTKQGREMFREALDSPFMESYFMISVQVDNQLELTCGQTTLVGALNSLKIDPGRPTWYGEYRWHCLDSLACSTNQAEHLSITKEQLTRLAICNDARAYCVTVTDAMTSEAFRDWVKFCTSRKDVVLVCSFSRAKLNQRGSGHFSPVVGYHEGRDMVLVAEVSKHKYPPFWVHTQHMTGAMNSVDDISGRCRGFILLCRPDYDPSQRIFGLSLLFRVDVKPGTVDDALRSFVAKWKRWLETFVDSEDTSEGQVVEESVKSFVSAIPTDVALLPLMTLNPVAFRHERKGQHVIVARCRQPHEAWTCGNSAFIRNLNSISFFRRVQKVFEHAPVSEKKRVLDLVSAHFKDIGIAVETVKEKLVNQCLLERKPLPVRIPTSKEHFVALVNQKTSSSNGVCQTSSCPGFIELLPEHIVTFLFLSWPYLTHDEPFIEDQITLQIMKEKPILLTGNHTFQTYCSKNNVGHNSKQTADDVKVDPNGQMATSAILRKIMCNELKQTGITRLNEEVISINRKLRVTLNYHNLL